MVMERSRCMGGGADYKLNKKSVEFETVRKYVRNFFQYVLQYVLFQYVLMVLKM